MVAKRFFYVCAGLLCLALAYHLGARSAAAFGSGISGPEISSENNQIYVALSANRFVSGFLRDLSGYVSLPAPNGPVPGTDDILATHLLPGGDSGTYVVLLANGDIYEAAVGPGQPDWALIGNLIDGTPAERATWGSVKARYR
jgi:hypothetical protein